QPTEPDRHARDSLKHWRTPAWPVTLVSSIFTLNLIGGLCKRKVPRPDGEGGGTVAEPKDASSVEVSQIELLQLLRVIMRGLRRNPVAETVEVPPMATEADMRGERQLRHAVEAGAIGKRHFPVLLSLALEGPATVSELAAHVALAPATTSLLVNELSRAGLV